LICLSRSAGDKAAEVEGGEQRGGHQVVAGLPGHGRAGEAEAAGAVPRPHPGAGRLPGLQRVHHRHARWHQDVPLKVPVPL